MNTIERLKLALATLEPITLDIQDDSALHIGHTGNTGGGHYTVKIISDHFEGLTLLKRHRLVYEAVAVLMKQHVHALSIQARTSKEVNPL